MASKGSEFGGHPGRIQPLPHELDAREEARLMRAIDPDPAWVDTDPAIVAEKVDTVEDQRVLDAGKRGIGPIDAEGNLA